MYGTYGIHQSPVLEPIKNKLAPASYIFSKIEIKKFKKRILRLSTYSNLHATCPPIEPWPKVYKNFFLSGAGIDYCLLFNIYLSCPGVRARTTSPGVRTLVRLRVHCWPPSQYQGGTVYE